MALLRNGTRQSFLSTHGGSRFSDAINTIRNFEKGATVIEGIAVPREQVARSKEGVLTWLKQIGMIE